MSKSVANQNHNNKKIFMCDTTYNTNWITILSIISCFAVVCLHANGRFWTIPDIHQKEWIGASIVECLFYFAVPCFFMISGATLINYKEKYNTTTYFKKRAKRTLIPYLIWCVSFSIVAIFIKPVPSNEIAWFIFNNITTGDCLNYRFFIRLFILYLFIPILANIADESKRKSICLGIIIVGFISTFFIPWIIKMCNQYVSHVTWIWSFSDFVYPIVYGCAGYLIKNTIFKKQLRVVVYTLAFAGLCVHLFGTYFVSMQFGYLVLIFNGYDLAPNFLYSVGIFILIKTLFANTQKNQKIFLCCNFLSKYTLSVYLTQMLQFLGYEILFSHILHISIFSPTYVYPIIIWLFSTTIFVAWIARKIPYAKVVFKYVLP